MQQAIGREASTSTDFDLAAYFERIGYSGTAAPTINTLAALVAAHNRSIPFENLDPLFGKPITDLSPGSLTNKMVHRRRGGYCYEQNGLMQYALAACGFEVDAIAGRVVWMNPMGLDGPATAKTHRALTARICGVDDVFLVDVGFAGQTPSSPIRLAAGPIQQTRHEPYRLSIHGPGFVLEALVRDRWQPLYIFTTDPCPPIDLEVGSWYASTYPASTFVVGLTATLVTDDARWNLRGRNLAKHTRGQTERIRFDTAAQVVDTLTNRFGIDLSGLGDVEARVAEVLDN
jgi:arylamine N-acetyltransferase